MSAQGTGQGRRVEHITATGWAEGGHLRSKLRRKWPMGPAGLPIPRADRSYLDPGERDLLKDIAKAAFAAEREREYGDGLPPLHRNLRSVLGIEHVRATTVMIEQQGFRRKHERQPLWGEIEAAWPAIGRWLSEQRKAMSNA